jgi:hypothetical protein
VVRKIDRSSVTHYSLGQGRQDIAGWPADNIGQPPGAFPFKGPSPPHAAEPFMRHPMYYIFLRDSLP